MLQHTIFGELVPVAPHRDDIVICSDGTQLRHEECLYDCNGIAHSNEDDYLDACADIVKEIVDAHCDWAVERAEHDDTGGDYAYCAWEGFISRGKKDNFDRIREWLTEHGLSRRTDTLIEELCIEILGCLDCSDLEYVRSNSEYDCYRGPDFHIDSIGDGECEFSIEQSAFKGMPVEAINEGCERYRGDACLHEDRHYDKETKNWGTNGYVRHDEVTGTVAPAGQWHYFVSTERIIEIVRNFFDSVVDDIS